MVSHLSIEDQKLSLNRLFLYIVQMSFLVYNIVARLREIKLIKLFKNPKINL